ncbi:hypothetical protein DPMN_173808 [Dreissena polymorpha]|uniref:Uncharacterized protein n=1 Tax=Dreissena polymorpha TaxID=45954 RepID=A0A9D4E455_DREPO|nr:hypothetical protein DPMN_173808 [Dreissena polymorpha]
MKLLRYGIEFQFVKGSDLVIADALSRAYLESKENETADRLVIRNGKNGAFDQFPDARILEIRRATEEDSSMQELQHLIITGWPKKVTLVLNSDNITLSEILSVCKME